MAVKGDFKRFNALFDPDGLPVLVFDVRPMYTQQTGIDDDTLVIDQPLAIRNDYAAEEHLKRVWE
jgi:hypothetical protein